jgi:hypothetical protein
MPVSQYTDNNGPNQQWRLVRVTSSTPHNPALPGLHADPQVRYLDGQYWIHPTTDGFADWAGTTFEAFSSPDLVTWIGHGVVLDLANVSWCHTKAWAPTIAYRDGTYWFYFSACQQIGVARSSSRAGPFVDALGHPLIGTSQYGEQEIDPAAPTSCSGPPAPAPPTSSGSSSLPVEATTGSRPATPARLPTSARTAPPTAVTSSSGPTTTPPTNNGRSWTVAVAT